MVRILELISKKKERQKAFLKKKSVLMKKAHELSVLCNVKVGLMIICPEEECGDDHHRTKPEPLIWPENQQEIHSLFESYKKSDEGVDKGRNYDLSKFFDYQTQKEKTKLAKLKQKNVESRRPNWDNKLDSLSSQELVQFARVLENKIQEIQVRADLIKQSSVTAMNASYNYNPLLLENKNIWQPMYPQYGGVDVPFDNTFDENMTMFPAAKVAGHGYGHDIQALIQHYFAPVRQPLQASYLMQSGEHSNEWFRNRNLGSS